MKKVLLFLFTLAIFTNATSAFAASAIQTWHLVDSGKHLDWDGSTIYQDNFDFGVDVWEDYKSGIIREDTIWIIEDVEVLDRDENATWAGRVSPTIDTLEFNIFQMDDLSEEERNMVAIHELGHALGLDHNTSSDIMFASVTTQNTLSSNDKASYDDSYDRY